MIKAVGKSAGVPTSVLLGLSDENWRRLRAGQPIPIRLHDLDASLPELTVVLLGGPDEASLVDDLRALGGQLRTSAGGPSGQGQAG